MANEEQKGEQFNSLLKSYLEDEAAPGDYAELMEMIKKGDHDEALKEAIDQAFSESGSEYKINADRAHELLYKILSAEKQAARLIPIKQPAKKLWIRIAAAAAIFIGLFTAGYFIFKPADKTENIELAAKNGPVINDALPGGNKAVLTLSNGNIIVLDEAQNGTLTRQGNSKVVKLENGQLAYAPGTQQNNGASQTATVLYNTVATPRGGQYQVTLEDGTKVWLNAASSLKFPTAFVGKDRKVELTGEAYFEVAKNTNMPFHVTVNGMDVKVLGTHFNINAYDDETLVKTTLLEGSVQVSKGIATTTIKPGEQAQIPSIGEIPAISVIRDINTDEAIAWKEGRFHFSTANITDIMRQVSRWYDVDISYTGNVSTLDFSGIVSRKENVSRLLAILESTGTIHFTIEGKRITVSPK